MQIKYLVLGMVLLALVGCGAPKYVVMPDVPTANLRLKTNVFGAGALYHERQDVTGKPLTFLVADTFRQGLFNTKETSPIRMTGTEEGEIPQVRERAIEAGKPFGFSLVKSLNDGAYITTCSVNGVFLPVPKRDYELVFEETGRGCTARLYLLSLDADGKIQREQLPLKM